MINDDFTTETNNTDTHLYPQPSIIHANISAHLYENKKVCYNHTKYNFVNLIFLK